MNKYVYSINNNVLSGDLCKLEMKSIFGQYDQFIITDIDVSSNKSCYIKEKLEIYNSASSFEELLEIITEENRFFDTFKLTYIKNKDDKLEYEDYISCIKEVAEIVNGEGDFNNPKNLLAIGYINDIWYFGKYEKNDYHWRINNDKPYSYSNAMSADLSRSIVNLAIGQDTTTSIIDPCCGVGTIIIDGLMQGANIEGTEINFQIGSKAQKNLEFFNLEPAIKIQDMLEIEKKYDTSILDIPYGIMSHTDADLQQELIDQCYKISDKLILVASEDLSHMVVSAGFVIYTMVVIKKHNNGKFNRHIIICKKK